MSEFVPFPRIAHLTTLGQLSVRDDKVMSSEAADAFLRAEILVEEKVDGENLGLSVVDGEVRAQSRGSYVEPGGGSFRGLAGWLLPRSSRIISELGEDLTLFGEWCTTRHSVSYDSLPDWFLVFDVYDRRERVFWTFEQRYLLAQRLHLELPPLLAKGRFDVESLVRLMGTSRLGKRPMEGLVLRHVEHPDQRAKLVRPEFVMAIDEHWRSKRAERNWLAAIL